LIPNTNPVQSKEHILEDTKETNSQNIIDPLTKQPKQPQKTLSLIRPGLVNKIFQSPETENNEENILKNTSDVKAENFNPKQELNKESNPTTKVEDFSDIQTKIEDNMREYE